MTNQVKFTTITDMDTVPSSITAKIEQLKQKKGYFYTKNDNEYIMTIFSGIKNTGGYSIKVNSVEDIEGITKVSVEEKTPGKNEIVTQAITYPSVTIKLPLIHERVEVVNTEGTKFYKLD